MSRLAKRRVFAFRIKNIFPGEEVFKVMAPNTEEAEKALIRI